MLNSFHEEDVKEIQLKLAMLESMVSDLRIGQQNTNASLHARNNLLQNLVSGIMLNMSETTKRQSDIVSAISTQGKIMFLAVGLALLIGMVGVFKSTITVKDAISISPQNWR